MIGRHAEEHSLDIAERDQPTEPMSAVVLSPFLTVVAKPDPVPAYRKQTVPMSQLHGYSCPQEDGESFSAQSAFFPSPQTSTYPRVSPLVDVASNGHSLGAEETQPRSSSFPTIVSICFIAMQLLLLVRFVLQLFVAPGNIFWVNVIYTLSSVFILPFRLLLQKVMVALPLGADLLNPLATLLAILVYGLLSRILSRFLDKLLDSH